MPISHKNRIIFIHIPKNAGTSVINTKGLNFINDGHRFPEYYKKKYELEWGEYLKFTIVRNPWDRVVSNYEYARMSESYWHSFDGTKQYGPHPDYNLVSRMSFERTLRVLEEKPSLFKHMGWGVQHEYTHKNDKPLLDKVFKLDELSEDEEFNELLPKFVHKNKSNRKYEDYKDYYNYETYDIVNRLYKKDIEIFDYKYQI